MPVSPLRLKQGIELMRHAGLKNFEPFSPEKTQAWLYYFRDWTDEQFGSCCLKAGQTLTFFPTVGEIRAIEENLRDERTTLAWEAVRQAVRRYAPYGSIGVSDVMNDGHALWSLDRITVDTIVNMTSDTRPMRAAEFRRLYSAAVLSGLALFWLPGIMERQNAGSITSTVQIGRPDLKELPPHLKAPPALEKPSVIEFQPRLLEAI